MPIAKYKLRVRVDYSKEPHAAYALFVAGVLANMAGNLHFLNPPISLALLETFLDQYKTLIAAAVDGSKTVMVQRNSLRNQIDSMVRQLAYYVEAASDNDSAIFATSGFEARPSSYASVEDLPRQAIVEFAHGANSGTVLLYLPPSYRKISHWQIRYWVAVPPDALPDPWMIAAVAAKRNPYSISGLQPGATYIFQIRGCGKLGYCDWSDSAPFICT